MLANWRALGRLGRVAASSSVTLCILVVATLLIGAFAPLLAIAAIGAVVARVPEIVADGFASPAGDAAVMWAVVAGALLVVQWSSSAVHGAAAGALGERVDAVLQRELMDAVMRPTGIAHLEDSATVDLINVGRDTFRAPFSRPGRLITHASGYVSGRIVLLGAALMAAGFHPLLGVAIAAAGWWAAYEDKVASRVEASHHHGTTELARRTDYYHELATMPQAAKEIRVFGLARFVHDRFRATWEQSMVDVFAPSSPRPLIATAILGAVVVAGVAGIARDAARGALTPGPAVVYAQALLTALNGVRTTSWAGLQTELSLATLRRFDDARAAVVRCAAAEPTGTAPAADLPRSEIRFEQVSFSYPDADHPVLHDFDLVIPAGRSLAIVGANGAGKTTVVKLLCRLYEPSAGRLTVDGRDASTLDPDGWRARIAAVFQDSVRFELPARTTVGFGDVASSDDADGLLAAAEAAGIDRAIDQLPLGWDTPLSTGYTGGADLSGGEWQKLGLARALFGVQHGAGVLILDEPAAHLDARAEADLYARFLAITAGITTVVISHRFSTVRQASAIAVIDDGHVIEYGTHDELVAGGGTYAEMFGLQAARFAPGPDRSVDA